MFFRVVRQFRRFLLGSFLLTLFMGALLGQGVLDWPTNLAGPLLALAWVITLILVIGIPVAILAVLMPALLPLVELWLITLLVLALVETPLLVLLDEQSLPGWLSCVVLFIGFIGVERVLYGPWLSRVWRRDMAPRTSRVTVRTGAEKAWCALFPDPAHADAFYWPEASFLPAPEGSGADFILSMPRRTGYKNTLAEVIVEASEPGRYFRYRTRPLPGSGDPAQIVEVRIAPEGGERSRITYSEQFLDVTFGQRLFFYLNHGFRDTLASLRARLDGRKDRSIQGQQMLQR